MPEVRRFFPRIRRAQGRAVVFAAFFLFIVYSRELVHERPLAVVMPDAEVTATAEGDDDVKKEREAVNAMTDISPGGPYTLVAKHL